MSNIKQEIWRERAINRRDENKELKKRIKYKISLNGLFQHPVLTKFFESTLAFQIRINIGNCQPNIF